MFLARVGHMERPPKKTNLWCFRRAKPFSLVPGRISPRVRVEAGATYKINIIESDTHYFRMAMTRNRHWAWGRKRKRQRDRERPDTHTQKIMVIIKAVFGVFIPKLGIWEEPLHLCGESPLKLHQSLFPCSLVIPGYRAVWHLVHLH